MLSDILTAIENRSLVRVTDKSGHAKGLVGIALGYNTLYDTVKVGLIDADGRYTGEYTKVAAKAVEVVTGGEDTEEPAPVSRKARRARARTARQTLRQRSAETRLRASLRRGRSLTTHVLAAGVAPETAKGVANGLRTVAKRLHIEPVKTARTRRTIDGPEIRTRRVGHYTAAQVRVLAANYRPRLDSYKTARASFLAA